MYSLPSPIRSALQDRPAARLHYSTLYSDENLREPFNAETFPPNLFKLELGDSTNFDEGGMDKLNALVTSSKGLSHMAVNPRLRFTTAHGRLPPIKTLNLSGECWPYQPAEISAIWDFSRLNSLSFNCANVRSFANSVPLHLLDTVTELSFRENEVKFVSEQISTSNSLAKFIVRLQGLRKIDVDLAFPIIVLDSLAKHQSTLRELAISSSRQLEEWLSPHDVKMILVSCPHLVELKLEFNIPLHPEKGDDVESYAMVFPDLVFLCSYSDSF